MRTTVNLPENLHRVASATAHDSGTALSETISRLLAGALEAPGPVRVSTSSVTGLRVATLGRPVTSDDLRSLGDAE